MKKKIVSGMVSGAAGSFGGDTMARVAPGVLAFGESKAIDLGPSVAAAAVGLVYGMVAGNGPLNGAAEAVVGHGAGRLFQSLAPELASSATFGNGMFRLANVAVGAVTGGITGNFIGSRKR